MSPDQIGPRSKTRIDRALESIDDLRALLFNAKRTERRADLCNSSIVMLLRRVIERCHAVELAIIEKGEP